jgi:hypothetical protein
VRKYCSSMPAKATPDGASHVGVLFPTARRSTLLPAAQMARAGVLRAANIPPEGSSARAPKRTASCPLRAVELRTSTASAIP